MTAAAAQSGKIPRLVVITDLDGTLLDQENYSYQDSLPAIRRLQSLSIPLVLCSSKTYAEMLPLWKELHLNAPFIVENGGAMCIPNQAFPASIDGAKAREGFQILELGTDIAHLRQALQEASRHSGVRLRTFGTMTEEEIAALTGLNKKQSALAAAREYDEPFVVAAGNSETLRSALMNRGFNVVKGDRFYHLTQGCDKGRAVASLLDLYRHRDSDMVSVGLGNSANDAGFLERVDRPFAIRNPDGTCHPELIRRIPSITCSHAIGPLGWTECIENVLVSSEL